MSKKNYDSILRMAQGAIEERLDYEMKRVMENILDPNAKAGQKRKIVLTIELKPDEDRQHIHVSATAKSALAPTNPVYTSLYVTGDKNGELTVVEAIPQIPGQLQMDGDEQEPPRTLKLSGAVS